MITMSRTPVSQEPSQYTLVPYSQDPHKIIEQLLKQVCVLLNHFH